jgi:predicted dehydrogenase
VLVGCGAMSRAWLDAARQIDGLKIVGLVDLDLDRACSHRRLARGDARQQAPRCGV